MLVLFVVSKLPKVVVGIAVVKLTCGLFVTVEIFVAREGGVEGLTVLAE